MTGLTVRLFLGTGTESNALRAGFGGVGRARSCMGSRLGTGNDVMTTGNDHVTAGQVSNNTLMGFFTSWRRSIVYVFQLFFCWWWIGERWDQGGVQQILWIKGW